MDWSKGFEARYYATIINKNSWRDRERFEITGGQITRSEGELRESADVDCVSYDKGEQWIRIWMDVRQNGEAAHIPMFTGLATSPSDDINGSVTNNSLECYSVLKPAQDVLLPRGWFAPSGITGTTVISDLLDVTPAPLEIEKNAPKLKQNIIAEEGETNLSMIEKILTAIDWRIIISGDGHIKICPKASKSLLRLSSLENDSIEPKLSKGYDWFRCPNVFRAVSGDESATAIDDSELSSLSTVNRGREIWAEETSCELNDGETLYEYAERRLKESQKVSEIVSYDRRFYPDVFVSDLITLHYPEKKIDGVFQITSQRIEIGYGAKTTEEAVK